ncbi:MAG: hypothetical protein KAT04_09990 [Methylococcales bacterium]|nr:hypothetical protein [Methylococcales bacterium]
MSKKILPFFLAVLPCTVFADHASISLGAGTASPIATESALTLPKGRISTGFRAEYIKFEEYSDSEL